MTQTIAIQVELDPATHEYIQAMADNLGLSMSELIQAHLLKVAAMDRSRKARAKARAEDHARRVRLWSKPKVTIRERRPRKVEGPAA